MRVIALMLVLMLVGPSLSAAACGVWCAEHHAPAADRDRSDAGCHDAPAVPPEAAIGSGTSCHQPVGTAVVATPAAPHVSADAPASRLARLLVSPPPQRGVLLTRTDHLRPPAPPPLQIPLRI